MSRGLGICRVKRGVRIWRSSHDRLNSGSSLITGECGSGFERRIHIAGTAASSAAMSVTGEDRSGPQPPKSLPPDARILAAARPIFPSPRPTLLPGLLLSIFLQMNIKKGRLLLWCCPCDVNSHHLVAAEGHAGTSVARPFAVRR